jgi:hypothetical protein
MTGKQTKRGYKIIWAREEVKNKLKKLAYKRREPMAEMLRKLSTGEVVLAPGKV